jgi:hypothetical protein
MPGGRQKSLESRWPLMQVRLFREADFALICLKLPVTRVTGRLVRSGLTFQP